MKTILIARSRKTGRDVLVSDREVPLAEQKQKLHAMYGPANAEYSEAVVAYVTPCSPIMKFASPEDAKRPPEPAPKAPETKTDPINQPNQKHASK